MVFMGAFGKENISAKVGKQSLLIGVSKVTK